MAPVHLEPPVVRPHLRADQQLELTLQRDRVPRVLAQDGHDAAAAVAYVGVDGQVAQPRARDMERPLLAARAIVAPGRGRAAAQGRWLQQRMGAAYLRLSTGSSSSV